MNQELGFETIPFEIAPEFQGELFEEEGELGGRRSFAGGGSRYSRPRSGSRLRPRGATRRPTARRRPPPKRRRGPWAVVRGPYGFVGEPYPGQPEPSGSERVRWVQDCLNQAMGLQLPVTGVMGAEARSAVRSFQKQQGLRVSGIVGPDTEKALKATCRSHADQVPADESEFGGISDREASLTKLPGSAQMQLPEPVFTSWRRVLGPLPHKLRQKWKLSQCYSLEDARGRAPERGGVYVILWSGQRKIAYVGQTKNLLRRLGQHRLCAYVLGALRAGYWACYYEEPNEQVRKREEVMYRRLLLPTGLVTNQREMEMELEQELWQGT